LLKRNIKVFKVLNLKERDFKINNIAKLKGVLNSTKSDKLASK
jgi:hypothetical protein